MRYSWWLQGRGKKKTGNEKVETFSKRNKHEVRQFKLNEGGSIVS